MTLATASTNVAEPSISADVLMPIAAALYAQTELARVKGPLKLQTSEIQSAYLERAAALLHTIMPQLTHKMQFNVQLVAQVKGMPDEAVLLLTQMDLKASVQARRDVIVRALRIPRESASK